MSLSLLILLVLFLFFIFFCLDQLLLEFLGLIVEGINDFIEVTESLNRGFKHFTVFFLLVENKAVATLVESAFNFLIKNHLRKLMEYFVNG
jgi:hypothetical protein